MLKQTRASYFSNFKNAQYCALSSDPIPDYIKNGDEVYIIDTAKRCLYDADSGTLIEQPSSGGGGSSDWTNASVTFINNTPENGEYFVDTPFGVIPIEEQETIVLPLKKEDGSIFYLSLKDIVDVESSVAPSVTGDITIEENGFEIQGDGSIAFSSLAPTEISGVPPLELDDALARPLRKLVQHGKVDVSGTDIICNNGTLKFGAIGKNLFDQSQLLQATDWTFDNETGYYYGSRSAFNIAFSNGFPVLPEFKENTQYSISLSAYNSSEVSATYLRFHYTDESQTNILISGTTPQAITATSTSGKTVAKISGTFGSEGAVMTYIKDFMLAEGATPLPYEPYTEGIYADGTPEEIRLNGINQWDEEWESGTISTSGEKIADPNYIRSKNYIPVIPNTQYFLKTGTALNRIFFYDADKTFISFDFSSDGNGKIYTTPANCRFVLFRPESTYGTTYNHDIFLNYPSTDTDYHPAHIQTATAENLFAVEEIEDTQDIVTGEVIHRTEAVVSDGTTPSGRYVGTVGEGNVIVRVREDKYEGEVVSFEAEEEFPLNKLVVNMSPQQDLHGYDNPWPAGGGKNLINADRINPKSSNGITVTVSNGAITFNGTATENAYFTISDTGYESGTYTLSFNNPVASSKVHIAFRNTGGSYWSDNQSNEVNKIATVTGEPDDILFYVVGGTTVTDFTIKPQLEKGSTATAFAPYSNICPIYGYTGVEAMRTGVNIAESYVTETATAIYSGALFVDAELKPSTTYTISLVGTIGNRVYANERLFAYRQIEFDGTRQSVVLITGSTISKSNILQYTEGKGWLIFKNNQDQPNPNVFTDIQLEYGDTATDYEEYRGNNYSVTFGALGKNLFDKNSAIDGLWDSSGVFIPEQTNYLTVYCKVKPNTTYVLSGNSAWDSPRMCFFNSENPTTFTRREIANISPLVFTTDEDTVLVSFGPSWASYGDGSEVQLEQGSSATAYEPYRDQVYGGNYDFINGKGKDGMNEVNFDDLSWSLVSSTYGRWAATVSDIKAPTDGATLLNALAEQYRIVTSNAYNNIIGTMYCVPNGTTINVCNGSITNQPSGKFVYELATPSDFQREAQPVSALEGENNIWSNAGTVSAYVSEGDLVEQVTPQPLITAEGDNTLIVMAEVDDIVFDVAYRKNNSGGETLPDARGVYF